MTKRELSGIAKRLAEGLPTLGVRGSLLFVQPIGRTLRGVHLERSSSPDGFYVWVFFQPLCVPSEHIYFNLGWRLGGGSRIWNVKVSGELDRLRDSIEKDAFPFLEPIKSPRDAALAGKLLDPQHDGVTQRAVAYAFARAGDTRQAIRELDRFMAIGADDQHNWFPAERGEAATLKQLLLTDPTAAQRRLQNWEAETLKAIGLDSSIVARS